MAKNITYDIIGTSIQMVNYARNACSQNVRDALPIATKDNCATLGRILYANTNVRNEFFPALYNLINKIRIASKMGLYENLGQFTKDSIEDGNTIEEVFVDLLTPYRYDPAVDANKFWKRRLANVYSAFHIINFEIYVPVTKNRELILKAFRSWDAVDNFLDSIDAAMVKTARYARYHTMKYVIAKRINEGTVTAVEVPALTKENVADITTTIKEVSENFEFTKREYNPVGVATESPKDRQVLMVTPKFRANMDVNVLAVAFNMDKAEFLGRTVTIDGFGDIDQEIVKSCMTNSDGVTCEGYHEFSQDELDEINKVSAMLVDEDFFQWYDRLMEFGDFYNQLTLEWNLALHMHSIISTSPFAKNAVFVAGKPSVKNVTVTPSEVTLAAGASIHLTVNVETENFASQVVNWTVDSDNATVDVDGTVKILGTAQSAEEIVVTATAVVPAADGSYKSATCTITVA